MQVAINIDTNQIFNALNSLPREEKIIIAEKLEEQLLSEWDSYENLPDTLNRVNESFASYKNNEIISVDDL
ncbi:MAG: hypothetical protein A2X64_05860 [Ignavibacteria bacterium GWF2_33_9]|nr:MAG: hypothetical protein A2X64_05860 [Ignavibacteria bacterium GWF2_33_9]